jgi:hypothetical protein
MAAATLAAIAHLRPAGRPPAPPGERPPANDAALLGQWFLLQSLSPRRFPIQVSMEHPVKYGYFSSITIIRQSVDSFGMDHALELCCVGLNSNDRFHPYHYPIGAVSTTLVAIRWIKTE